MDNKNMTVADTIREKYTKLFPAEQKVAKYIVDHTQEVVNYNVAELAKKSQASEATVVRTCKHLGFDGYYQMRLLLSKDVGKFESQEAENENLTSSQKFFSLEAERVNRLSNIIDFTQIIEVAKALIHSRIVHIVAVGNTTPISQDLGFRLERAGIACTYSALPEHYYNHISLGTPEDTVVAITRSGASKQVIRAIEIAHKKKMKVVLISAEPSPNLLKKNDICLQVNDVKNESATITRPDSHLVEFAVNDAILYAVRNILKASEINSSKLEEKDSMGILLSEFKV